VNTVDSHADPIAVVNHLTQTARPALIIAGNGMCSGGRIVNYLKAMLHDPRHDVLFVGYQAKGTPSSNSAPGAAMSIWTASVSIFGRR